MTSITLTLLYVFRRNIQCGILFISLNEVNTAKSNPKEVCRNALPPNPATVCDLPVTVDCNVILLCFLRALHLWLDRQKEWVLLTSSLHTPDFWWCREQWMLFVASRPVPVLSRWCSGLWPYSPLPPGCCGICPLLLWWEESRVKQNTQGWFKRSQQLKMQHSFPLGRGKNISSVASTVKKYVCQI